MKKALKKILFVCVAMIMVITLPGCSINGGDETDRVTLSFYTGGGTHVQSQTVSEGGRATRPSPNPQRSGYLFADWYTDSARTQIFDFNTYLMQDTTIFARWIENETGPELGSGIHTSAGALRSIPIATDPTGTDPRIVDRFSMSGRNYFLIDAGQIQNTYVASIIPSIFWPGFPQVNRTVATTNTTAITEATTRAVSNSVTTTNTQGGSRSISARAGFEFGVDKVWKASFSTEYSRSWNWSTSHSQTGSTSFQISHSSVNTFAEQNSISFTLNQGNPVGYYRAAVYVTSRVHFVIITNAVTDELISWETAVSPVGQFTYRIEFSETGIFNNAPSVGANLIDFAEEFWLQLEPSDTTLLDFSTRDAPQTITIPSNAPRARIIGQYPTRTFTGTSINIQARTTPLILELHNFGTVAPAGVVGLTSTGAGNIEIRLTGRNSVIGGVGNAGETARAPVISQRVNAAAGSNGSSGATAINVAGKLQINSNGGSLFVQGGHGGDGGAGGSFAGTEDCWNGQNHGGNGGNGAAGGIGISSGGFIVEGIGEVIITGGRGGNGGAGGTGRGRRDGGSNVGTIPRAGDGGRGGNGGAGGMGVNVSTEFTVSVFSTAIFRISGGAGGNGARGGNGGQGVNGEAAVNNSGGNAGRGGNGGVGGQGITVTQGTANASQPLLLQINGGAGGDGGRGGNGGRVWAGLASGALRPRAGRGGIGGNGGAGGVGLREVGTTNFTTQTFPNILGGAGGTRGNHGNDGAFGNARPTADPVANASLSPNGQAGANITRG